MSSLSGKRLLHYSVVDKIGVGGMGEVWRASDTTLGRDVAIKILPEALATDPERLSRFEREARLLAAMNHPNIAGIYGLHVSDGVRFLAMELAAGEDLADRLTAGPIPVEEAVQLAIEIAAALEYAHERGIVHRDLKPANIKLTPGAGVKVLDFGLAKALTSDGDSSSSAGMPTLTSANTRMGTILGTAAYMSPEQARGRPVDRRTDIWAFGCVVYEMLTGRRPFEGETNSDTLAAVLRQEVDWSLLPANAPVELQRLLRRCLVRDPHERLHDIGDARIVLGEIAREGDAPATTASTTGSSPRRGRLPVWIAAAFVLGGILGFGVASLRPSGKQPALGAAPAAFRQLTSAAGGEGQPALAPDGQSFAFVKRNGTQTDIFVQRVDGRNALNLTSSCPENDEQPAFSPDGQRIAFRSERSGGGIFVMGATGESARRVADFGFNPAWSPDGREVAVVTEALGLPWARITESKLWAVNVETGVRRLITEVDAMQPAWSPDGTRIVFWGLEREKSASQRDLWIVPASGSNTKRDGTTRLTNDAALDWSPVWAPDGKALYFASSRGGTMNIWRLAMDPGSGQARGVPSPVTAPSSWVGWLTPSQRGDRLGFVDRNARTVMYRAPFDPNRGQIAGPAQPIPLGTTEIYDNFVVSPDGESVLFSNSGLPQHIFLARIDGSEYRQLTDGPYRDRQASFSPDGQWVAFQTSRFPSSVGVIRSDGSGLREVFSEHTSAWYPTWSPDGTQIVVASDAGPYILNVNATSAAGSIAMRFPPVPQSLIFMPGAWSSDGKTILGDMADASKGRGILSFSLGDRSYRAVSDRSSLGSGRARYLPDNRRFVATYDDKLLLQDGETGQWREILAAPEGHTYTDVSVSADGRWIAFLEVWDESDIWLAELEAPKPVP